ncbi:RluA family pseudouridine synthase [Patescibacteria group bacterium]
MTKLNFTYQGPSKQRLDSWLGRQVPDKSRAALQELVKAGQVYVNDVRAKKPSQSLQSGDVVAIDFPPPPKLEPDETIELEIVAEEPTFLVVNKPSGLVVHPGSGNPDKTLTNGLIARYPEIVDVGEDPLRPGIVHRLDKDTSGVMVIARSQGEYENLKKQFQERETEKTYLAVLDGEVDSSRGTIEGKMRRSEAVPVKRELVSEGEGKDSRTDYEVIDRKDDRTLVKTMPRTGRMHQLRVHFASIGHPIVGDRLYGSRKQTDSLQLHAQKLHFRDSLGIWREYEVAPPLSFQGWDPVSGLPTGR